jgi:ribokinase
MSPPQRTTPIVVVGSTNRDYLITVHAAPQPGETVLATAMRQQPGGKGANQAVAAARMHSGGVAFIGCVGDDPDGALLLQELRAEGVDTSETEIVAWASTGVAIVQVFADGQNAITVVPGANFEVPPARVTAAVTRRCGPESVVVLQAEVRPAVIAAAVQAATEVGARTVLNLAPYTDLDPELLLVCDPLVVNEQEAAAMLGRPVRGPAQVLDAARELQRRARSVVITAGADGACWADENGHAHVPAEFVDHVVDTTGAGDAFVGALASRLAKGAPLPAAVEVGVRAGSFAVTRPGAQSSYPMAADVLPPAPPPVTIPAAGSSATPVAGSAGVPAATT